MSQRRGAVVATAVAGTVLLVVGYGSGIGLVPATPGELAAAPPGGGPPITTPSSPLTPTTTIDLTEPGGDPRTTTLRVPPTRPRGALLVPEDIAVGKTWSTESDYTVEREGASLAVHQSSSAEVVERSQTTVAGRPVEVWVVQRHETQTRGMGDASVVSDVLSSELVAPQLGLVVERLTRADVVRSDGSTQTVTIVERLQELP